MVRLGIRELDRLINKYRSIELESDWMNHVNELVKIIRNASYEGLVHIVFYSSSKYCDIHKLYLEIEPYLESLDNVSIFWESNIEAFIYHVLMLDRVKNGYLFLMLPYDRTHLSQIENTYLYKLVYTIEQAHRRGWNIIIINPIKTWGRRNSIYVADITVQINYYEKEALVKIINVKRKLKEAVVSYSFK
ncbi:MAG: hypothetical protein B6U89_06265 [Desulfurococcales archaeon ex4484_58]|nr:MAG: hypothetical protein B6U89_06265 [Desulfurococcales archaeon ex4484_58]